MNLFVLSTVSAAACILIGCASPGMTDRVTADHARLSRNVAPVVAGAPISSDASTDVTGGLADADRRAKEQAGHIVLRRSSRPWVASVSVPMGANEKLPSVFQETVKLNFNDAGTGGKVGLRQVAERITSVTGVPVRVKPDVFTESAQPAGRVTTQTPVATTPLPVLPVASGAQPAATRGPAVLRETSVHAIAMRWHGSLEGFLNHITDLTNLSWEYREGVIVIERFRTEFFELAALDGETQYAMGLNSSEQGSTGTSGGGAAGGLSTSNASADVAEKGKAATVATLIAAVNQIISPVPGSAVIRSEGSGRIAVTTTKDAMSKVRDFLRAENESMLRQAQIQFDIYSVRRDESDERGIDWSVVIESVSRAMNMTVLSPATLVNAELTGNVSFSVLSGNPPVNKLSRLAGGSSTMLHLLNQYGTSTQHRPVSLLTLNRQWARKASLGSKAYVSETVPGAASTLGAGAPGLKTATVTTGDRYLAQPFIMDNSTVVLKFGIGLSSLVQIATFESGEGDTLQRVQIPEVNSLIDQSTVALKAGQLLVITGLSRVVTADDTRKLDEDAPLLAGGSRKMQRQREDFVIFVRPTIL